LLIGKTGRFDRLHKPPLQEKKDNNDREDNQNRAGDDNALAV
jgi:hypothetical protein